MSQNEDFSFDCAHHAGRAKQAGWRLIIIWEWDATYVLVRNDLYVLHVPAIAPNQHWRHSNTTIAQLLPSCFKDLLEDVFSYSWVQTANV